MRQALDVLAREGLEIALALSVLLAIGALAVRFNRSPVQRHRLVEGTLGLAMGAVLLLVVPLPRLRAKSMTVVTEAPPLVVAVRETMSARAMEVPVAARSIDVSAPLEEARVSPASSMQTSAPLLFIEQPAPPVAHVAPTSPTTAGWLLLGFALCAVGFALHFLFALYLLRRLARRASPAPDWLLQLAPGLEGPRVIVSSQTQRPFCFGLGDGTIVLPATLVRDRRKRRLRAVLLHEQAHLAQHHGRLRLFTALATPLLYWQPLFWWLVRTARQDAELVADDLASGSMNKRDYASELLELVQSNHRAGLPGALSLGAFGSRNHFLERMETLLMRTTPLTFRESRLQFVTRSSLGLVLLTGVSLAWGRAPQEGAAQEPRDEPKLEVQQPEPLPLLSELFDREQGLATNPQTIQDPVTRTQAYETTVWRRRIHGMGSQGTASLEDLIAARRPHTKQARPAEGMVEFQLVSVDELRRFQQRVANAGGRLEVLSLENPVVGSPKVEGKGRVIGLSAQDNNLLARFLYDVRPAIDSSPAALKLAQELNTVDQQIREVTKRLAELRMRRATLEEAQAHEAAQNGSNHAIPGPRNYRIIQGPEASHVQKRSPSAIDAQVLSITERAGVTFVTFNRGSNHGVQVGTAFEVYRESTYKGRVEVTHVNDTTSSGKITMAATRMAAGDSATTDL